MPISEDIPSIKYTCILFGKIPTVVLIKTQTQIPTKPGMFTPTQHFTVMDKRVPQRVTICVDYFKWHIFHSKLYFVFSWETLINFCKAYLE